MNIEWVEAETNTHQDHVIAHVIGATALGYFVADEALHFVLDIGFIWSLYVDGEMGLLLQSVALAELNETGEMRDEFAADMRALHGDGGHAAALARVTVAPENCLVEAVRVYRTDGRLKFVIQAEDATLIVVSRIAPPEFHVYQEGATLAGSVIECTGN